MENLKEGTGQLTGGGKVNHKEGGDA